MDTQITSQQATSREQLFAREDPHSLAPDDARHWIAVYQNLIEFCDALQSAESPSPAQRHHLREHRRHFASRIDFWRQRLREVE